MPTDKRANNLNRYGGRAIAGLIKLVENTSTKTFDPPDLPTAVSKHHPFILACWHGQFMLLCTLNRGIGIDIAAMVARHGDADLIGEAMRQFDVELVRGAGAGHRKKDRGGSYALRACVRALNQDKRTVVMTADVPPGPARRAGDGIIQLARFSGRPIIPIAAASSRYTSLKTWSRLTVNLPFSKLAFVAGDPIFVDRAASPDDIERHRRTLEARLSDATFRAYANAGSDAARITPNHALPKSAPLPRPSLTLKTYRTAANALKFAVPTILKRREQRGKEDPARRGERYGQPSLPRPDGRLVWFHAASVGETNTIAPIAYALKERRPDLNLLLTTGTTTSAAIAEKKLVGVVMHQYVPVDIPSYARAFLKHWQPDLAVLTESEIWPNLIIETKAQDIPIALVNGRMSSRSFSRWKSRISTAEPLFGRIDTVMAQNAVMAYRFRELGTRHVILSGNLKYDAPAPAVDPATLEMLKGAMGDRPTWLAASTHDPEETYIAKAHRQLAGDWPNLLTIIVPRHPQRGVEIGEGMKNQGLRIALRSNGDDITPTTDIYIADTLGELGTFYAAVDLAFIGGSLSDRGGQNPIEAIRHDCSVISGRGVRNFEETYNDLETAKGTVFVKSPNDLPAAIGSLLRDSTARNTLKRNALEAVNARSGARDITVTELLRLLAQADSPAMDTPPTDTTATKETTDFARAT